MEQADTTTTKTRVKSARGKSCVVDTPTAGDAGHGELLVCPVEELVGTIVFNSSELIITITIISDGNGCHVLPSGVCRTSELRSTHLVVPSTVGYTLTHGSPAYTFVLACVFCEGV